MALPRYSVIAEQIGVQMCRGIRPSGMRCYAKGNHDRGFVAEGFLHWSDRMTTREGIKRFLSLAAEDSGYADMEPWERLWTTIRRVGLMTKAIGVRIPLRMWAVERAKLRAMLLKVPASTPGREEAMYWLGRKRGSAPDVTR